MKPPQKTSKSTIKTADLLTIIHQVESDLASSVASIVGSFEVFPDTDIRADRELLRTSGLVAARRIQYAHQRISNLSKILAGDANPSPSARSVASLTREAVLFAIAQDGRFGQIAYHPKLADTDLVVRVDADRVVHMLASLLLSISARLPQSTINLSMRHSLKADDVELLWQISTTDENDWPRVVAMVLDPGSSAGELALHDRYWNAISELLGSEVTGSDIPQGIAVRLTIPVVREISPPEEKPNRPWTHQPALIAGLVPESFTPLRAERVQLRSYQDLQEALTETGAGLLVLNQPADDEQITRLNIALSQMCDLPVLLRAEHLTYEQLNRYRPHVDAILMEPSAESTLAQYVIGLSANERRAHRRVAEIH